jgi:hypothetical protein
MLSVAPHIMAQGGGVSVKLNNVELKGNALNLDADVRIGRIQVGRYESVSLTFVLKGTGRGQTLSLPPVIICGANKYQMYQRAIVLHGATAAGNGAYAVLKNAPELIQFQAYKRAVAYKSWMSNCQLILVREVKNYHNNTVESSSSILSRNLAVRGASSTNNRQSTTPTNRPSTYNLPPATNPANNRTNPPANNRTTTNTPANKQPANTAKPTTRPANNRTTTRPANNGKATTTTRPAANTPSTNKQTGSTNTNKK